MVLEAVNRRGAWKAVEAGHGESLGLFQPKTVEVRHRSMCLPMSQWKKTLFTESNR